MTKPDKSHTAKPRKPRRMFCYPASWDLRTSHAFSLTRVYADDIDILVVPTDPASFDAAVERMAQALQRKLDVPFSDDWSELQVEIRDYYRDAARAALKALGARRGR